MNNRKKVAKEWKEKHGISTCGFENSHYKPRIHNNPYSLWGKVHGYQRVVWNGKLEMEHRVIWQLTNGVIPEGYEIHHKDKNRLNNKIENLELISKKQHFGLHKNFGYKGYIPWNKGMSNPKDMVNKCQKKRHKHYLPLWIRTYIEYKKGLKQVEIAKKLDVSRRTVADRIKNIKNMLCELSLI
jgi:hypothetical protein